jgi:hypothetical protein
LAPALLSAPVAAIEAAISQGGGGGLPTSRMPAGCAGAPHPSLRGFECPRPVCAFEPAHGNVVTDADGYATVTLPEWFEALNRDFRYQLTVIGQFAQAIVDREVENNSFVIRTNLSNVKGSWQVTGIRQDAWANARRVPVEEESRRGLGTTRRVWGLPGACRGSRRWESAVASAPGPTLL